MDGAVARREIPGGGAVQETGLLAFARYPDLERAADRTAAKIKEGFMEMGYILKVARDTDILAGSGYGSHEEFAEKRYGLDKGTVSRYIRIVERFSVGGNSHVLVEGYKDIGFAKLSLMLHMPDAIAEEITANYSKAEVQEIKEEIDAERAVSDLEIAIEDVETAPEEKEGTLLERAVRQLGREQPELYLRFHNVYLICDNPGKSMDRRFIGIIMDALAPQGEAIHMTRVPGLGRVMLSVSEKAASVTVIRTQEKMRHSDSDVGAAAMGICHHGTVKESYLQEYGEPMEPEAAGVCQAAEEKAAAVQQKEKRKESKVTKAAAPKKGRESGAMKTAPPQKPMAAAGKPESREEPLPGQQELRNYPDVVPTVQYKEIAENAEMTKTTEMEVSGPEQAAGGEKIDGELLWMDMESCSNYIKQWLSVWTYYDVPEEFLVKAHQKAASLAATIEKLMDVRGFKNVEEHSA